MALLLPAVLPMVNGDPRLPMTRGALLLPDMVVVMKEVTEVVVVVAAAVDMILAVLLAKLVIWMVWLRCYSLTSGIHGGVWYCVFGRDSKSGESFWLGD